MTQRVEILLLDDLELAKGNEVEAERTVNFELDGSVYEIDLNQPHEDALRAALSPFVQHARLVKQPGRATSRPRASRRKAAEIRSWARDRGIQLNDRGRIPGHIEDQYNREHAA